MIKELKVNFYRLVRAKSFLVICILFIFFSIFASVEIKFCVDDPFGLISEAHDKLSDSAVTTGEYQSYEIVFTSLEEFKDCNNLNGPVQMALSNEIVCFLFCIVAALFVSNEYKSRFHVNHYSLSPHPTFGVFMEWLSIVITVVFMEILSYALTLVFAILMCNSYHYYDLVPALRNGSLSIGISIAMASFAFMVAFIRRAGALAIVLSSFFAFGLFDFFFGVASAWFPAIEPLALTNTMASISLNRVSVTDFIYGMIVVVLYTAICLTVTLVVAAKRDAY